jgi:hypothetical protein
MKPFFTKLLLWATLYLIVMAADGQQRVLLPLQQRLKSKTVTAEMSLRGNVINDHPVPGGLPEKERSILEPEYIIGKTLYDLQSFGSLANRLMKFDDGTFAVVWTMGFDESSFDDRGTGYNYFNGTHWLPNPTARIEQEKCSTPSIAPWGAEGEIVAAQSITDDGIRISRRSPKGSGSWEYILLQGPSPDWLNLVWPRICASGGTSYSFTHVVSVTLPVASGGIPYLGQDPALLYSRSSDGGTTWNPHNIILPGTDGTLYMGIPRDSYAWAEPRDSVIAFSVVDCWIDLFIMKSNNNGETWEKITVWEHPYPLFDWNTTITCDTIWAPDKSGDISIDNEGKVHLVFGLTRVAHPETGPSYIFWPFTDGIAYWNETMPPFTAPSGNQHDALDAEHVLIEDVNLIGWTQDVDGSGTIELEDDIMTYPQLGISTMPNIDVDDMDRIIVVYASTTETYTNGIQNFKHIWKKISPDNGVTWGDFVDLTGDPIHIFDECIYPVLRFSQEGWWWNPSHYCMYQADASPGLAYRGDHPYQENIIYFSGDFGTGIDDHWCHEGSLALSVSPNPFNNEASLYIDSDHPASLELKISDLYGREIYSRVIFFINPGRQKVTVDGSEFAPGLYLCSVSTGHVTTSTKMVRTR